MAEGVVAGEVASYVVPFRADTLQEFRALYEQQFGPLAAYCAGLVEDRAVGADLAQEAFTRLFSRWRHVQHPRAYVYLVATHLVHGHWRRRRDERVVLRDLHAATQTVVPATDPALRDAVERMPERLRTVLLLHYWADLPLAEIARIVHRPLGTVKQRLHEARRVLHDTLEADR